MAARRSRSERISFDAEDRSVSRKRCTPSRPKGKIVILPRDATPIDFAYNIHSEVGQHLRWRQGERAHCPAALQAALGRHRRDSDPARPSAQPRLAGVREVVARAAEDQALAEHSSARARHRNRPQADREGSAQVSHLAEGNQRGRADAGRQREWPGASGRPAGGHRLRQVLGPLDPGARWLRPARRARHTRRRTRRAARRRSPAWCGACSAETPRPSR